MSHNHWSSFWDEGHTTTFGKVFKNNYEGDIRNFWVKEVESIKSHSYIHDLAAGRCAIARIVREYSDENNMSFVVSANDYADIQINSILNNIDFYPQTASDKLPLESSSIDLMVSQYGFEYSPLDSTLSEVVRVLKPQAKFVAIVHSEFSELIVESKAMHFFLQQLKEHHFYDLLEKFANLVGNISSKKELALLKFNTELETTRMGINDVIEKLMDEYPDEFHASENMAYLQLLFQEKMIGSTQDRLAYVNYILNQNVQYQFRLDEMIGASYHSEKLDNLSLIMSRYGQFDSKDFVDSEGRNLGKVLNFIKA